MTWAAQHQLQRTGGLRPPEGMLPEIAVPGSHEPPPLRPPMLVN
jgi:hypothetical protein